MENRQDLKERFTLETDFILYKKSRFQRKQLDVAGRISLQLGFRPLSRYPHYLQVINSVTNRALEESLASAGIMKLWQANNQCTEFSHERIYDDDRIELGVLNKWTNCLHKADINNWIILIQGHKWGSSTAFDTPRSIWNFLKILISMALRISEKKYPC